MARNGFSASEPWGRREAACCLCQGLFYPEEPRQRTLWESLELLGRHIQTSAHTCGPHQTHEDRLWPENNGTWGSPDKVVTIFIEPPRVRHPVASGHVSPTCFPSSPLGPSSLNSILSWIVFLCPHRDVSDHSTQITLSWKWINHFLVPRSWGHLPMICTVFSWYSVENQQSRIVHCGIAKQFSAKRPEKLASAAVFLGRDVSTLYSLTLDSVSCKTRVCFYFLPKLRPLSS